MTTQTMVSISLDALKVYRGHLEAAHHFLGPPILNHPEKVDAAIGHIRRLHELLTADIEAAECPEVVAGDAQVNVTIEEENP